MCYSLNEFLELNELNQVLECVSIIVNYIFLGIEIYEEFCCGNRSYSFYRIMTLELK